MMARTMATDDDNIDVNGNGVTGNVVDDDDADATGENNNDDNYYGDNNEDGNGDGTMGCCATVYNDDNDRDGR